MTETRARDEICRAGRSLFARGYAHGTVGNISVRLDDGFLITPADACLGHLEPSQLTRVSLIGQHTSGPVPSVSLGLHRRIYQATHDWATAPRCVLHTHSSHLVALSLTSAALTGPGGHAELLPPVTPYFVMKVGRVPLIAYHRPGAPKGAQAVAQTIAAYLSHGIALRAVMLPSLGPNVWHQTPADAMAVLEELEETARVWLLTGCKSAGLSDPQLDELWQTFGASW